MYAERPCKRRKEEKVKPPKENTVCARTSLRDPPFDYSAEGQARKRGWNRGPFLRKKRNRTEDSTEVSKHPCGCADVCMLTDSALLSPCDPGLHLRCTRAMPLGSWVDPLQHFLTRFASLTSVGPHSLPPVGCATCQAPGCPECPHPPSCSLL